MKFLRRRRIPRRWRQRCEAPQPFVADNGDGFGFTRIMVGSCGTTVGDDRDDLFAIISRLG